MKQIIIVLFVVLLTNCTKKKTNTSSVVARVYDYVLTIEELKENILKTNTVVDSLRITEEYIKNWSRQKLLYRNALINLENTSDINKLVDKYREELFVSYYKNALINKKLDTLIFKKEIDSFYVKNRASFRLNEDLIKFKYIHVAKGNRKRQRIKKLFNSKIARDKETILNDYDGYDDFCFNDSTWVSLKSVYSQKAEFPILSNRDLKNTGKLIEKTGVDRSLYYICIDKILTKGDFAPVDYVRPTIKNILLHKNKIKFFDQMEQILIDEAVKQKKYEVY